MLAVLLPAPVALAAANWSLEPTAWDFGPRLPGSGPSEPKTFTLTNTGDVDLTVTAVGVGWFGPVGTDPELFALTENLCFGPLPIGASCTIGVTFNPSTPGRKEGLFSFSDELIPPGTAVVRLYGGEPEPEIQSPPPFIPPSPRVALRHRPPKRTKKRNAGFWFRGSSTATAFACKLDREPFSPCHAPVRFRNLAPGKHRFSVRAFDSEGISGPTLTYAWRILRRRVARRRNNHSRDRRLRS